MEIKLTFYNFKHPKEGVTIKPENFLAMRHGDFVQKQRTKTDSLIRVALNISTSTKT
jgi:hypothetical protein